MSYHDFTLWDKQPRYKRFQSVTAMLLYYGHPVIDVHAETQFRSQNAIHELVMGTKMHWRCYLAIRRFAFDLWAVPDVKTFPMHAFEAKYWDEAVRLLEEPARAAGFVLDLAVAA